jgi:hypothetical protein
MFLILLPNTNILSSLTPPLTSQSISTTGSDTLPVTLHSSQFYLNRIKEKTAIYNYTPFINAFVNLSNPPITNSFFIFIELIQEMEFLCNTRQKVMFKNAKGGVIDMDSISGIMQAFYHIAKIGHYCVMTDDIIEYKSFASIPSTTIITTTILINPQSESFVVSIVGRETIGSNLILTVEDCFDDIVVKLLYYLCSKYEKVFVTKPMACWLGSSTKYIVCKNRLHNNIIGAQLQLSNVKPTNIFINRIEEMNCIFVEQQIDTLLTIFNRPDRTGIILKAYQQKCIGWFIKHQLGYSLAH